MAGNGGRRGNVGEQTARNMICQTRKQSDSSSVVIGSSPQSLACFRGQMIQLPTSV